VWLVKSVTGINKTNVSMHCTKKAIDLKDGRALFMHVKAIYSGDYGKQKVPSNELVRLLSEVEKVFVQTYLSTTLKHRLQSGWRWPGGPRIRTPVTIELS
jgi:hypothetical protein